jgi:hypothetical protein
VVRPVQADQAPLGRVLVRLGMGLVPPRSEEELLVQGFVRRLTSRKFLLAVAAFATFCAEKQYVAAAGVVAAYLGVQGVTDFRSATAP